MLKPSLKSVSFCHYISNSKCVILERPWLGAIGCPNDRGGKHGVSSWFMRFVLKAVLILRLGGRPLASALAKFRGTDHSVGYGLLIIICYMS